MNVYDNKPLSNHIDGIGNVAQLFTAPQSLVDSKRHETARGVLLEGPKAEENTCAFHRVGRNPAILNSIGVASYGMQIFEQALLFFRLAFKVYQLESWATATRIARADIMGNIGLALRSLGRQMEAIELYRRACVVIVETGGRDDKRMLRILQNLASAYFELGQLECAITHLGEAYRISTIHNGVHLDTIEIVEMMGWANHRLGRNNEAVEQYRAAIILRGQIGLDATETMYSQAVTLQSLGQLDNALTLLDQTWLNVQEGKSQDQALTANISKSIGLVHLQKGQFKPAVSALTQAWQLETQCLGTIHPNTANTIANLGVVYSHLGKISKSVKLCKLALRIRKRCGVKADEEVADVHHNLACAMLLSKRRSRHKADIARHFKRSVHLYAKDLGVRNEKTRRTRELYMSMKTGSKGGRRVAKAMVRH